MVQMAAMSQFSGGAAGATASNMRTSQSPQQQHAQHAQHQQQQLEQSRLQQQQQQPEAQRLQHYRSLPGELSPADAVETGGGLHLHQAVPGSPNFASSRSLPGLHDFSDVRCPAGCFVVREPVLMIAVQPPLPPLTETALTQWVPQLIYLPLCAGAGTSAFAFVNAAGHLLPCHESTAGADCIASTCRMPTR